MTISKIEEYNNGISRLFMESNLRRIIKLIQKTGDRFIVMDSENELPYIIMSLSDYERWQSPAKENVKMSEGELLEKINREIALWRAQQELKENFEDDQSLLREERKRTAEMESLKKILEKKPAIPFEDIEKDIKDINEEDKYYFEPVEA